MLGGCLRIKENGCLFIRVRVMRKKSCEETERIVWIENRYKKGGQMILRISIEFPLEKAAFNCSSKSSRN